MSAKTYNLNLEALCKLLSRFPPSPLALGCANNMQIYHEGGRSIRPDDRIRFTISAIKTVLQILHLLKKFKQHRQNRVLKFSVLK